MTMRSKGRGASKDAREGIIAAFAMVLFSTAAAAQPVVPVNGGLASVVFPRGEPRRATSVDGASQANILKGIDEQLAARSQTDKQSYWRSYLEAQLNAPLWFAQDLASGQFFSVSDYDLPANMPLGALSCDAWLRDNPTPKYATDRKCKDLVLLHGQAIELRMATKEGHTGIEREYLVGAHRYRLGYSNYGGPSPANGPDLPYVAADDSAKFFGSFRY